MSKVVSAQIKNAVIDNAILNKMEVKGIPVPLKVPVNIVAGVNTGIDNGTFLFDRFICPNGYCVYGKLPVTGAPATAASHALSMAMGVGTANSIVIPTVTAGSTDISAVGATDTGTASVSLFFTSNAVVPAVNFSFFVTF